MNIQQLNKIMHAVLLLLPSIIFAWSTPYNISKNDTSIISCTRPCIAIDKTGIAHVVWEAWRSDNYWGPHWIMYSCGKDTTWSEPVWLSNDTPSVSSLTPNIVVDSNGHPFAGWSDEGSGNIYFTYHNGVSWKTPQVLAIQGGGHSGLRMAVDKQNNIHATWHSYSDTCGVYYSLWNWSSWTPPLEMAPDSNILMGWPDIALDSYGNPHIIAMDYRSSLGYPLAYFKFNGLSWQKMANPPDTSTGQSCAPRLCLGLNDTIHLVWEERVPIIGIYLSYYAYGKNNIWSSGHCLIDTFATAPQVLSIDKYIYCYLNPWVMTPDQYSLGIYQNLRDSTGQWSIKQPITSEQRTYDQSATHSNSKIFVAWARAGWIECSYDTFNISGIQDEITPNIMTNLSLYILKDIYPNPFTNTAKIIYVLKNPGIIILNVYNLAGQLVKSHNYGFKNSGTHELTVTADSALSSGIYFYNLKSNASKYTTPLRKFVIIH